MSIVIVGGHDRMVAQYKKICKSYKCKCKVFTQMEADWKNNPLIYFNGSAKAAARRGLL